MLEMHDKGVLTGQPKSGQSRLMIGYARVSTEEQDLTTQRDALTALKERDPAAASSLRLHPEDPPASPGPT